VYKTHDVIGVYLITIIFLASPLFYAPIMHTKPLRFEIAIAMEQWYNVDAQFCHPLVILPNRKINLCNYMQMIPDLY